MTLSLSLHCIKFSKYSCVVAGDIITAERKGTRGNARVRKKIHEVEKASL